MLRSIALAYSCLIAIARAQGDLAGLLQAQPDLSTLLDLITLTDLNETLSTSTNITILAPTNAALDALIQMDIPEASAVRNRNVTTVAALLNNHVWRGYYPSSVIGDVPTFVQSFVTPEQRNEIQPFTSITGGQYNGIIRNGEGVNLISGELNVSNVTMADIRLGEGIIIHIIDSALMFGPPLELFLARGSYTALNGALTSLQSSGTSTFTLGIDGANSGASPVNDITIFVPVDEAFENIASILESADLETLEDVVTYHILNENIVFSPSLGNITATTLQGGDLTFSVFDDGSIFVNDAKIVFANVILSNGVAHITDSVINPSNTSVVAEPNAAPEERVQFASATSASELPFSTFTFTELANESYTTPALLSTYLPISLPTTGVEASTTASATGTASPSVVPYTGAAGVVKPCMMALGVVGAGVVGWGV